MQLAICLTNMKITNDNCWIALSIKKSHGFHQSLNLVFEKVTSSKLYVSRVDVLDNDYFIVCLCDKSYNERSKILYPGQYCILSFHLKF